MMDKNVNINVSASFCMLAYTSNEKSEEKLNELASVLGSIRYDNYNIEVVSATLIDNTQINQHLNEKGAACGAEECIICISMCFNSNVMESQKLFNDAKAVVVKRAKEVFLRHYVEDECWWYSEIKIFNTMYDVGGLYYTEYPKTCVSLMCYFENYLNVEDIINSFIEEVCNKNYEIAQVCIKKEGIFALPKSSAVGVVFNIEILPSMLCGMHFKLYNSRESCLEFEDVNRIDVAVNALIRKYLISMLLQVCTEKNAGLLYAGYEKLDCFVDENNDYRA